MSSDPHKTNSAEVEAKLRRAWRKERRFHNGDGFAHFVVWLLALVLIDLLVDWLFLLPGSGRVILLVVNVAVLGWVLWHYWLRHLRRYDPVRVALQVERRHPELESLLVSYVQLGGDSPQAAHASPSLLRVLRRQTIEVTQPIDFREIISYNELKRIAALSAAVLIFFALYSVNWGKHLEVLARRLLDPSATVGYPTRTTIERITGDCTLRQGDSVTLRARAGGLIPKRGSLRVEPKGGERERIALFPGQDPTEFAYRFREVFQSFDYSVRLGDARSKAFTVSVVPPPRVVETRVHLRYPDYTQQKTRTVEFLNLEVPEGTEMTWELICDKPLRSAGMLRDETDLSPMALDETGKTARLALTAAESFSYQFRWTEQAHGYQYEDAVHYFVQVIPDSPPQVDLVFPLQDDKATVNKTLTARFLARDDYGIARAWIVYQVNDSEEQRREVGTFATALVEGEAVWKLAAEDSIPDLKVGDVVTYAIEVADTHEGEGGPQISRSDPRKLFIVSRREYLRYIYEKRRRLRREIAAMRAQEGEAETEVNRLKIEAFDMPRPPGGG
ncbi:MAG: DUF4175 family protein [Planctomycetota bacterium]